MTSPVYGACGAHSPSSHYDVILIVTSFATELATPTIMDVRTDTLPRLIYKDVYLLAYAQSIAVDCSVKRVHLVECVVLLFLQIIFAIFGCHFVSVLQVV